MTSGAKDTHLQIRLSAGEKARLKKRASRAGLDLSAYVISRALPPLSMEFDRLVRAVRPTQPSGGLAALNDFLAQLTKGEFGEAVSEFTLPLGVDPWVANYVAAMVEHTAWRHHAVVPVWSTHVPVPAEPWFATELQMLRFYLLAHSPPAFRRRNLFVDATVGDRV